MRTCLYLRISTDKSGDGLGIERPPPPKSADPTRNIRASSENPLGYRL